MAEKVRREPVKTVLNIGRRWALHAGLEHHPNGAPKNYRLLRSKPLRRIYRATIQGVLSKPALKLRALRRKNFEASRLATNSHERRRFIAADRAERKMTK